MYTCTYLDRDKVGLTFIGNGLGQQSLSTPWGTIEQNTLRGGHTKLEEFLRVLNRVLQGWGGKGSLKMHA